jgi:hypothetical protein
MVGGARFFVSALSAIALFISLSSAAIPAGYTGTPYKGTPQEIPGRVEFENYDVGAENVTWHTDNKNQGSGSDYRTDDPRPCICVTNKRWPDGTRELDSFPDGSRYPSATDTVSYYLGYTHPGDNVYCTVHVKVKGKYWISSSFSSDETTIGTMIKFNNVEKPGATSFPTGTPKGFHVWRTYPKFASVELDTGLQVMYYEVYNYTHQNWDYLLFELEGTPVLPLANQKPGCGFTAAVAPDLSTVNFYLSDPGLTRISLLDCAGKEVKIIYNSMFNAGKHSVGMDVRDLSRGVFFLNIQNNGSRDVVRVPKTK